MTRCFVCGPCDAKIDGLLGGVFYDSLAQGLIRRVSCIYGSVLRLEFTVQFSCRVEGQLSARRSMNMELEDNIRDD